MEINELHPQFTVVKIISQKFIHHTQRTIGRKMWRMWENINKCLFIQNNICFWMKIVNKRGKSILTNGRRWRKATMVLVDGVIGMLGPNAYTVQVYTSTWASVCVWHNHGYGGGIGFGAIFEDLWEANAYALMICSSCNVF